MGAQTGIPGSQRTWIRHCFEKIFLRKMIKWQIENSEKPEKSEISEKLLSFWFCPTAKIENLDLTILKKKIPKFLRFPSFWPAPFLTASWLLVFVSAKSSPTILIDRSETRFKSHTSGHTKFLKMMKILMFFFNFQLNQIQNYSVQIKKMKDQIFSFQLKKGLLLPNINRCARH